MFETERLYIRNFKIEDSKSCFEGWGTDRRLGRYILGYPMKITQMEEFVSSLVENKNAWVIIEKKSKGCIGYITIDIPYIQLGIGEIGYVIGERFQHRGYAYEAIDWILQEYLETRGLYMVEAKYNADNVVSGNLLKKLGFQIDGEIRNRRIDFVSGKRNNLVICSITKEDRQQISD